MCSALLDFPVPLPPGVRCVPGDIGKLGVSLLISSSNLDVRDAFDDQSMINHALFDKNWRTVLPNFASSDTHWC